MSGEWRVMSLADAGVILLDCDHKTPEAVKAGRPYVGIPQMVNGRIDFSTARQISESDFTAWTRKTKYQTDDVVLSRRTNPGVTAIDDTGTEFALGQNLVLLRSDGRFVYPPFLRWLVSGPEWWAQVEKYINVGAVFNSLRCRDVPRFEMTIPPLPEQRVIAATLGALDNKIDLNRRMNETLEEMAKALFKDWFVDFGPTRAKMEGREPYLAPDLWALFPDKLDEDGRPDEWGTKPLDEIADFLNGLALQKFPPEGNDSLPVIKISQLRSGNADNADRASRNIPDQYVVQDGDVIFSWSGSLMQRVWTAGPGALNQHLFKVTSEDYPKWFYYFWIDHYMPNFQAIAASKATTMGHIQRRHLTEAITCVAEDAVMAAADHLIGPLFARMIENDLEARTLANTRDILLPKLISGEISLQDAETAAGKAL